MFLKACFGSMILSALFCIHVGDVIFMSAILENYASWLVITVFCICRLEKPFDQDVIRILLCYIQVVKMYAIPFDLCTALMDHLYFDLLLPHLRAPCIIL